MNKDKLKEYAIVIIVFFFLAFLLTAFVRGTLLIPEGGRFAIVLLTVFATAIYALITEEISV